MNENERRRAGARRMRLAQLPPEERGQYELDHAGEVIPASPQVLEAAAKLRDHYDNTDTSADMADGTYVTAQGTVLTDADCDALAAEAEAGYDPEKLTPRPAGPVPGPVLGLERPVEGGHQDRQDPAQQAQGDQVDAGTDAERGQAEAHRPSEQEK